MEVFIQRGEEGLRWLSIGKLLLDTVEIRLNFLVRAFLLAERSCSPCENPY